MHRLNAQRVRIAPALGEITRMKKASDALIHDARTL
jgi:hypothetical protein